MAGIQVVLTLKFIMVCFSQKHIKINLIVITHILFLIFKLDLNIIIPLTFFQTEVFICCDVKKKKKNKIAF